MTVAIQTAALFKYHLRALETSPPAPAPFFWPDNRKLQ